MPVVEQQRPIAPADAPSVPALLRAAADARQQRRFPEAIAGLTQAIALAGRAGHPLAPSVPFDLGCLLFEARRLPEAEQALRAGLARHPGDFAMTNCLGVVLKALGRYDDALAELDAAARLAPERAAPWINRGSVFLELGRPRDALPCFEQAALLAPDDPQCERLIGVAARGVGDMRRAADCLGRALTRDAGDVRNWVDLAWLHEELNDTARAWSVLEQAIARFGLRAELIVQRAIFLRRRGRHGEAIDWLRALAVSLPREPAVHHQLGLTIGPYDRLAANRAFHAAMALDPTRGPVIVDFADSLLRTRVRDEAKHIQAAYELARYRMSLAGVLPLREAKPVRDIFQRCADYEAMAAVGSFDALGTYFADAGLLAGLHPMLSQARTPADRRSLIAWHRKAGDRAQQQAAKTPLPARPARVPRAKIRVGLMSSDLRDHPVSYFVGPMLEHYDRTRFEFHCYSWSSREPDAQQRRFAGLVDRFHHVKAIGNRDAAALIAADELDVLFELGGSTDMNKLEAMAWRPAPRQASWLGYPHSAGYTTIDRLLVDPYICPDDPALMIEQPFRMPATWVAFDALGFGPAPAIDPLTPQERTGHVTFGTMNNTMKYNAQVFAAWAEVLSKVPGSRFLFVRPEGAVPAFRENVGRLFERHGVEAQRVDFVPVRGAHLPHYNRIDIALDTFPHTGGTTTCETLWMGVPTVAKVGEAFFERLSYSNLSNAGVGELAVPTRAQYVATAVELAGRTAWRGEFRRTVRERLRALPLGDTVRFTRDFEQTIVRWMDEGGSAAGDRPDAPRGGQAQ
jgi:tetratricopeptide (TPR) repeat protein